jgi:hypothetical protein
MGKTHVRVVFVGFIVLLTLSIGGTAYAQMEQAPSESELSRQAEKSFEERKRLVPPADGVTVVTSQSGTVDKYAIMAFAPDGRLLYYNDTYDPYFDVDPVPGTETTVEYVAAQQLNGTQCDSYDPGPGKHCVRNVVERVNLTTGDVQRIYTEMSPSTHLSGWHDVDRVGPSRLLVADIFKDRVFIVNTTTGIVEWEWQATTAFDVQSGGNYPRDWTHLNDVELLADGRIMVDLRNHDQIVFIDRETGVIENQTIGSDDDLDVLYEQHNPDYIPAKRGGPAVVVADSENNRLVEFQREDGEWNRTWVWTDSKMQWPRDADRLPNGNTLVSDTHSGRLFELSPSGDIVWKATIPDMYEAERLGTGDESAGGESAQSLGYASHRRQSDAQDRDVDDRLRNAVKSVIPAKAFHGISFIAPWWMNSLSLLAAVLVFLTLALWAGVEAYWLNQAYDVEVQSPLTLRERE